MKTNMPITHVERLVPKGATIVSKTDLKGITTYANEAFWKISGFSAEELIGKNHNVVRHPDMPVEAFADLWKTLKAGRPWRGIVKNRCKNGDFYWVDALVTPIVRNNQIAGYMSTRKAVARETIAAVEPIYRAIKEGHSNLIIEEGKAVKPGLWHTTLRCCKNITIKQRLLLMTTLLIASVIYYSTITILDRASTAQEAAAIHTLVGFAVKASSFVHESQRERGMTTVFLGSKGAKFSAELATQRKETDSALSGVRQSLVSIDATAYGAEFNSVLNTALANIDRLQDRRNAADALRITPTEAIDYYSSMNTSLLDSIAQLSKMSSHVPLVISIRAYDSFLRAKEKAGIERAILTSTFASNQFAPGMLNKFVGIVADQSTYLRFFSSFANSSQQAFYQRTMAGDAITETANMRKIALDKASEGNFGVDYNHWFKMISAKIGLMKEVENYLSSDLLTATATLNRDAQRAYLLLLALTILLLAITMLLVYFTLRAIILPLRATIAHFDQITQGNLEGDIDISGKDEPGSVLVGLACMQVNLKVLIDEISLTIHVVNRHSDELKNEVAQISAQSQKQQGSVMQVSAAMEEVSVSVTEVADSAGDAATAANASLGIVNEGSVQMTRAVESISRLAQAVSTSSATIHELGLSIDRIGAITQAIKEIADQTNLLALNAAIEAARAGEQGRGFAVVADEVRKLAARTANSTADIAKMVKEIQTTANHAVSAMNEAAQEAQSGSQLLQTSSQNFQHILSTSQRVTETSNQISSATSEQSIAVEDVAKNMEKMSALIEQNCANIMQVERASMDLAKNANVLQEAIQYFRIAADAKTT